MEKIKCEKIIGFGVIKSLNEKLLEFATEGSTLCYVVDEGIDSAKRVKSEITKKFFTLDLTIDKVKSVEKVREVKLSKEVRAIVTVGGGKACDIGKYLATKFALPLITVVLSQGTVGYLVPSAMLENSEGEVEIYKTVTPSTLICDGDLLPNLEHLTASGFGDICARLCSLFDARAEALLLGVDYSFTAESKLLGVIGSLLRQAEEEKITPFYMATAVLQVSEIIASLGSSRLYLGGESQLLSAFTLVKRKRSQPTKLWGESVLALASIAMRAYASFLALPSFSFVRIADNNTRLDRLISTLGLSVTTALKKITPLYEFDKADRLAFSLRSCKGELIERAVKYSRTLDFALKRFKRLYKDRGYSYNNYITSDILRSCIMLAPEMNGKFTLFSAMKQIGVIG